MLFVKRRTRRVTHIYYTPSGPIEFFFVFMEAPGATSPATLSRPMAAKSRRKSASPTPRCRGDPAPVARSPGAHGSRQLSRCPRNSQPNVTDVFRVSCWSRRLGTLTIGYDYCVVPYVPGRHGIPSERTGPTSAHDTSLSAPCSPPREIWRSADVYCCRCILLQLLLLLCCGYCCGCCCFYCCIC